MEPRRKQPMVSFRSRRAFERLRVLTRDGRSQAEVIEQALDREPEPASPVESEAERSKKIFDEIMKIIEKVPRGDGRTMIDFDAEEYDEDGLPR